MLQMIKSDRVNLFIYIWNTIVLRIKVRTLTMIDKTQKFIENLFIYIWNTIVLRIKVRTLTMIDKTQKFIEDSMPEPLDYDLRTKAIEAVKRGEKKLHVAQMLNISRNTLDLRLNSRIRDRDL
ncbi:hypothetical protein VV11_001215 [Trichodesmium erythraeum 21-75]|nr:hypothetical protein [Trichodesmium erythraeum 21-75]